MDSSVYSAWTHSLGLNGAAADEAGPTGPGNWECAQCHFLNAKHPQPPSAPSSGTHTTNDMLNVTVTLLCFRQLFTTAINANLCILSDSRNHLSSEICNCHLNQSTEFYQVLFCLTVHHKTLCEWFFPALHAPEMISCWTEQIIKQKDNVWWL